MRERLDTLDAAAPLSAEEQRIIDERVAAYRQNPQVAVPWGAAEAQIRRL